MAYFFVKPDVTLLIGQVGGCKIPTDEQRMAFDYFVPATERGCQLAQTFIIEDMGNVAVAMIHGNDFDVIQFSHLLCTSLCLFVFIKNAPFQ